MFECLRSKYAKHLPLDRQAKTFKENGINLGSNILSNWVINSSETYLSLLYDRMHACIYDSKVMHVDETPENSSSQAKLRVRRSIAEKHFA